MSSGGSNYSTGTTGNGPMTARIESPISKGPNAPQGGMSVPVDSFSSPAPGGKGGFPSAQSPYAQQQPQVYMPPQQPTMYQQAFPQQYGGYNNFGNAYARRMPMYSPQTPIEASPPPSEMNYAPGGYDLPPQELMSDSWRRRPRLEPTAPVEATRGVISESNYSGGLGSLISSGLGGLDRNYVPSEAISTSDRRFNPMTGTSGPSKTVYTDTDQQRTPYGYVNTSAGSLWNA